MIFSISLAANSTSFSDCVIAPIVSFTTLNKVWVVEVVEVVVVVLILVVIELEIVVVEVV